MRSWDGLLEPFRTERLTVRPWGEDCALPGFEAELAPMIAAPVLRYLPPNLTPRGSLQEWVADRNASSEVLSVRLIDTSELIGLAMIRPDQGAMMPTVFVGYMLAEAAWGQGYASELVGGLLGALREKGPLHLRAGVEAENTASSRVLLKAGFVEDINQVEKGMRYYKLDIE